MGNFFISLINSIIAGIGALINGLIGLLPTSPFQSISNTGINLSWLNWLVPISEIIAILQTWIVAVAGFYVVMIIFRWIKMIE